MITELREMIDERGHDSAAPTLAKWPPHDAVVTRPTTQTRPVTDYLPEQAKTAPALSPDMVGRLSQVRHQLFWQKTYSAENLGQGFLDRYGWTFCTGPGAAVEYDALPIVVLLLGPDVDYSLYQHAAEEIYLPFAGTAS